MTKIEALFIAITLLAATTALSAAPVAAHEHHGSWNGYHHGDTWQTLGAIAGIAGIVGAMTGGYPPPGYAPYGYPRPYGGYYTPYGGNFYYPPPQPVYGRPQTLCRSDGCWIHFNGQWLFQPRH